jgi:L-ribulokinase
MAEKYTIGLDYGTDSVRSLIVNVATGEEVASAVFEYPTLEKGMYCDPVQNQFRQHPKDYIEGLEYTVTEALKQAPKASVAENVVGFLSIPPVQHRWLLMRKGTPLSLTPGFEENPNAMFVLWKDHTALKEADEINTLAANGRSILPGMKAEFILRNGSGQNCCM